jgi:hypothetical protein
MSDDLTQQERYAEERARRRFSDERHCACGHAATAHPLSPLSRSCDLCSCFEFESRQDFDAAAALKRLSQGQQAKRAAQIAALEREVVRAARAWNAVNTEIDREFEGDETTIAVSLMEMYGRLTTCRHALRAAVERLEAEAEEGK